MLCDFHFFCKFLNPHNAKCANKRHKFKQLFFKKMKFSAKIQLFKPKFNFFIVKCHHQILKEIL